MTLTSVLKGTPVNELLRAINSNKEYLLFTISVFNTGASIWVKCTNVYKEINRNNWNGYDFIIENDHTTKFYIASTLKNRINEGEKMTIRVRKRVLKAINDNI
jgi:hypothetical protein